MTYDLTFLPSAKKEWDKLSPTIKEQFKTKLKERLHNPHIPSAKLSGFKWVYKIKLRSAGYRLVYEVVDQEIRIYVVGIGKRNKDAIYNILKDRL